MSATALDLTVVIGLGRSGRGAARLLQRQGHQVCVIESSRTPSLEHGAAELRRQGIDVRLGLPLELAALEQLGSPIGRAVVSPGIRWDHPTLDALRQRGIQLCGELVPAWEASRPWPWIGITGTNGKTTVTHLVSHLLQACGIDAPMAGNVGRSAAEVVLERQDSASGLPPWMVVELSSYQIEAAPEVAPRIGIWTTLTPDHLERHGTLEAYRAIKRSLLERSEVRLLNADDPDLRAHASSWDWATWVTAGPREALPAAIEPRLWIEGNRVWQSADGAQHDLMAADCLAMPGDHNRQNMLLAAAVGLEIGLTGSQIEQAFRRFPGVPHRLERIGEVDGITYYNDSKATNYDAAEVALRALAGPLVVLAGGQAKIGDASGWIQALQRKARGVVLFGQARTEFRSMLERGGYTGTVTSCEGLAEAVPLAQAIAQQLACSAVLLSPACASFDQYSDFEARGDHFRGLVLALQD